MPFSRIALHQGKSADYLQTLSDSLHQALVEAFEVPPTDKFQVIDQYCPGELIYDRDYLGGPRSWFRAVLHHRRAAARHRYQAALLRAAGSAAGGEPAAAPRGCDGGDHHHPVRRVVIQRRACLDDRSADVTRADAAGGLWDNSAIISFR